MPLARRGWDKTSSHRDVAAWAALVVGLAYASVSAYWGAGGTGLLGTVGGVFERWGRSGGMTTLLFLWVVVFVKVVAAALPFVASQSLGPVSTRRRALAWHAYLWDPWFLIWGVLALITLGVRRPDPRDSAGARRSYPIDKLSGSPGPILPPARRATTHDVRGVQEEHFDPWLRT